MDKRMLKNLNSLNDYLDQRKAYCVKAFQSLFKKTSGDEMEFILMHFTYENIEVGVKGPSGFTFYQEFDSVISREQVDDITSFKYDPNDVYQDFMYSKYLEIYTSIIEVWILSCFTEAGIGNKMSFPLFYKANIDSMKIIDLRTGSEKYEKSEFDLYYTNNKINCLEVYPV